MRGPDRARDAPAGPVLPLRGRRPFAVGSHRRCYVHPGAPDLCVKLPARPDDAECHAAQRRDLADQRLLRARWPKTAFDRIPAIRGRVETDLGPGIAMRLYRDGDGRISRSLSGLVAERGAAPFAPAIREWKQWLFEQRLITCDTGPHNLIAVRLAAGHWKLMIAEGWLHPRYRWLGRLHPAIARRPIGRQLRKFDAALGKAGP